MAVNPITAATIGPCEWCKNTDRLTPISDWEEHGSFAPRVYEVCPRVRPQAPRRLRGGLTAWAAYMEMQPRYSASPMCGPDAPGLTFYAPG